MIVLQQLIAIVYVTTYYITRHEVDAISIELAVNQREELKTLANRATASAIVLILF